MTESQRPAVQSQSEGPAEHRVLHPSRADEGLNRLIHWGRARRAATVLDIATDGGLTALAFSGFTPTVVAIDETLLTLTAARARFASQGAAVHFVAADVGDLPFRDESFGVVTCRMAAHRFRELLPALRQVARVLRRGGSLLVEDRCAHDDPDAAAFIVEIEKRRDPRHVRSFRALEWTAFLRAAGLTVIDEATVDTIRPWEEWTGHATMSGEARAALDRFVLDQAARYREAFRFEVDGERIRSFADQMLLLRADKD